MTKKHFEAAAQIVRTNPNDKATREEMAYAYCLLFEQFNPRFDRERFMAACFPQPVSGSPGYQKRLAKARQA